VPFTPSHAVVALPFVGTRLVPAAIAVGAMTPDLPLFLRAAPLGYARTHDFAWLPATILLALALLLVWRSILRPASRELAPRRLAVRLPDDWDHGAAAAARDTLAITDLRGAGRPRRWGFSWSGMLLLVASLAIGVVSHILWDLFTHEGRWGVTLLPALGQQWGPLVGYKWLQHGSSLVGIAIITVWVVLWLRRRDAAASVPRLVPSWLRWAWWLSLPGVLVVAWLVGLAAFGPLDAEFTVAHLGYRVLPPACALWGIFTLALAIGIQFVRKRELARAG